MLRNQIFYCIIHLLAVNSVSVRLGWFISLICFEVKVKNFDFCCLKNNKMNDYAQSVDFNFDLGLTTKQISYINY
jgi:hypothetical protein